MERTIPRGLVPTEERMFLVLIVVCLLVVLLLSVGWWAYGLERNRKVIVERISKAPKSIVRL